MPILDNLHPNQFGYKKFTSCKSAFMMVNETLHHYDAGGSNCHVVSLDAAKAFDKLWRDGLFYKLKDITEPAVWRVLRNYYSVSHVTVCYSGLESDIFQTNEGVKQGG